MKSTEPVTHLFLGERLVGSPHEVSTPLYVVTLPQRIAENIGADDLLTMDQFLGGIDRCNESLTFEVALIGEEEAQVWAGLL